MQAAVWLERLRQQVDEQLVCALRLDDEAALDPAWSHAFGQVRSYTLRPGKRLRPALLFASYTLSAGSAADEGVWAFASGLELLHTFMLIHDDIADNADLRRGDTALHMLWGGEQTGSALATVAGDHLFARAIEVMLGCGLQHRVRAVEYYLSICRQTAVGQFLDLELARTPLHRVSLARTLKVARLKTAQYSFVAPLVSGAILAGNDSRRQLWQTIGRNAGLAYQLSDDLLGLFGDSSVSGKSSDGDYFEGKRTFPLMAAYVRADDEARLELEALWTKPNKQPVDLQRALVLIERFGGRQATERAIACAARVAHKALEQLHDVEGCRSFLTGLIGTLAERQH